MGFAIFGKKKKQAEHLEEIKKVCGSLLPLFEKDVSQFSFRNKLPHIHFTYYRDENGVDWPHYTPIDKFAPVFHVDGQQMLSTHFPVLGSQLVQSYEIYQYYMDMQITLARRIEVITRQFYTEPRKVLENVMYAYHKLFWIEGLVKPPSATEASIKEQFDAFAETRKVLESISYDAEIQRLVEIVNSTGTNLADRVAYIEAELKRVQGLDKLEGTCPSCQ
ncbi:MAG: hypothetical protein QXT63_06385 [Thermoplasmata archaeon]